MPAGDPAGRIPRGCIHDGDEQVQELVGPGGRRCPPREQCNHVAEEGRGDPMVAARIQPREPVNCSRTEAS